MSASAWHYGIVSDPTSNVLSGADGTEVPDFSDRTGEREAPWFPPLPLPAIPNFVMTREEVAAALDKNFPSPVDQDHAVLPEQRTPQQPVAPPDAPPATAPAQPARAVVSAPDPPAQPASRTLTGVRLHPSVVGPNVVGSRAPEPLDELRRRRISLSVPRMPLPTRSDGGAAVFFITATLIFLVLAYIIVMMIVESIIQLF